MKVVETTPPSFPDVSPDALLTLESNQRWQVACGDEGHWRVGFYSPAEASPADIQELERHDCPEFFMLVSGKLSLYLSRDGVLQSIPLEPMKPILVESPHCGFCPDGPHTGVAVVVERDAFNTEYRKPQEW